MSSPTDENKILRKHIGCMNGIFQIFDRHHFLTGRRITGHHHKRLLRGAQHKLNPQHATSAVTEKGLDADKEKPRTSSESSRASYSSSSCSSTFSSLDFNRIVQPETLSYRHKYNLESPYKEPKSLDLRDVVKDSMYREARSLSIKSLVAKDEKKGTVIKHIDSPRPSSHQSKPQTPKLVIISEGSIRILSKIQEGIKNSKDERLALARFSCDERESQDSLKWAVKHKEFPRLSLDSKASSAKCSRMNFLGRDPHTENENPGQNRTSSVVAKLMGLENFPDPTSTYENRSATTKSCPKEESNQNQSTYSPCAALTSPRFHNPNSVGKLNACSKYPIEPACWRQHDSSQDSPGKATHSEKAQTNNRNLSFSIYGEIERRVTELQFQKSSKDLRALKQILEAMQKNRERLENRTGDSAECTLQWRCGLDDGYSGQSSSLSMWKNNKSYQQVPKKLSSSVIVKQAKVMDKARPPVSNQQGFKTLNPKHHEENSAHSAHRQKTKDLTSKNNNLKDSRGHLNSTVKKTSGNKKIENCTASGSSFGMVSPRLQQNLLRIEAQSQPTTPSLESGRAKRLCSKKLIGKGLQNRKHKVKAKDVQLNDDQVSELSSETRYSSDQNATTSIEVIGPVHSANENAAQKQISVSTTRENMPAVEIVVTMFEQPSPISVLDNTFYSEDSPSPVKKISTEFQDESPSPHEAEWQLENLNHLTDCTSSDHAHKYNQKLENLKDPVQEFTMLTKPDATEVDHNALVNWSHNPGHRYINKILQTSGLLKDSTFISTTHQLISSRHLINPDMFHVLERTEEIMAGLNGEVTGKNDRMQSNQKIQRKVIFDMVDEILVRRVTSGRLFTSRYKKTNPQGLLKEVYLEIDRMCRIPECNLDDEEDEMIRLLSADMMYQDDWVDYSGEVPALVLDIERQIFKDLINEVVATGGEVMGLYDWPLRNCRKLFSK